MNVIIQDTAHDSIDKMFEYLCNYSPRSAIQTIDKIYEHIYTLKDSPYIGRYIPEISNKHFRELIYRKTKNSGYRIMYHVSETTNLIHIIYVANSKQDFNRILKLHNYFNNFLKI